MRKSINLYGSKTKSVTQIPEILRIIAKPDIIYLISKQKTKQERDGKSNQPGMASSFNSQSQKSGGSTNLICKVHNA